MRLFEQFFLVFSDYFDDFADDQFLLLKNAIFGEFAWKPVHLLGSQSKTTVTLKIAIL